MRCIALLLGARDLVDILDNDATTAASNVVTVNEQSRDGRNNQMKEKQNRFDMNLFEFRFFFIFGGLVPFSRAIAFF